MGFFLRKSKKFGLFNLNLSKNGLGFSFGLKGLRISAGSRGLQLNAGRNGLYFRKSLNGKTQKKGDLEQVIVQESPEEIIDVEMQERACLKKITKSPEQENFEFLLSIFTACFLIAFIGLFFKFWLALTFGILAFIVRNFFIKNNAEKYEVYKLNPEPQLYYLGKTKNKLKSFEFKPRNKIPKLINKQENRIKKKDTNKRG